MPETKINKGALSEEEFLARLIRASAVKGISINKTTIINFYISLKSKPLAILVGPKGRGKIKLVECFSRLLTKGTSPQYHQMVGHAHWAAGSQNVALFTYAQTRFNSSKILAIIEEAYQPGKNTHFYVACLSRVSPAELVGYFSALAFQLRHGQIMRLPSIHLKRPIPFPENLALVGTMDIEKFDWFEEDLLSRTTVIQCLEPTNHGAVQPSQFAKDQNNDFRFLNFAVRDVHEAKAKLRNTPKLYELAESQILKVARSINGFGVTLHAAVIDEAFIYLGNAWSSNGIGLFDPSPWTNLDIALDLALSQTILPRIWKKVNQSNLFRNTLSASLGNQYIHSQALLVN